MLLICMQALLALCLLWSEESIGIYILPSPSAFCPLSPCITLTQFASNESNDLHPNTRLIFQPGDHTLDSQLSITNINKLTITSNSTVAMGTVIVCKDSSRFNFNTIGEVVISGLNFIGCGSNRVEYVSNLLTQNTGFVENKMSGAALKIVSSSMTILNSSFTSNKVGGYWSPPLATDSPDTLLCGGALVVTQSNITITGSQFKDNSANVGGAIYAEHGSNIKIMDCSFENNHATCLRSDRSGALEGSYEVIAAIDSCEFSFNIAKRFKGGAIGLYFNSIMTINGSLFDSNTAILDGGVVAAVGSEMIVDNSKFKSNIAFGDGGVISTSASYATVNNSQFINNMALFGLELISDDYNSGGVISSTVSSTVIFNDCDFYGNKANVGGIQCENF